MKIVAYVIYFTIVKLVQNMVRHVTYQQHNLHTAHKRECFVFLEYSLTSRYKLLVPAIDGPFCRNSYEPRFLFRDVSVRRHLRLCWDWLPSSILVVRRDEFPYLFDSHVALQLLNPLRPI